MVEMAGVRHCESSINVEAHAGPLGATIIDSMSTMVSHSTA